MDVSRFLRGLAWNAVVGLLLLLVIRALWVETMPLAWWAILLAAVFGFPGTIVAVLLWVYVVSGG